MSLFGKLFSKIRGGSEVSAADWQEIEKSLLLSDLGASNVAEIIKVAKSVKGSEISEAIKQSLAGWLSPNSRELNVSQGSTSTFLIVGVNGTGKTTSSAKLAHWVISQYKIAAQSVVLAAADTFRAAAVEQLVTWGNRLGSPVVTGKAGGDPASVSFDAAKRAQEANAPFLIIDTAGRLHTKSALMEELGKVRRVTEKVLPINEVLLVVDATTGQNGIAQAKIFNEAIDLTGIILTKMDGSAQGGIALAIEKELGIPVKFVGTGESIDQFAPFDSSSYLAGLIGE
jgi:fused signal recognition particle receptor